MIQSDNVASSISAFLVQKFPAARKKAVKNDTPLLESGVIDSLGILDVVAFLESSFNVQVADDELTPENFASISCMAAFVEQKRNQHGVSVSQSATPA